MDGSFANCNRGFQPASMIFLSLVPVRYSCLQSRSFRRQLNIQDSLLAGRDMSLPARQKLMTVSTWAHRWIYSHVRQSSASNVPLSGPSSHFLIAWNFMKKKSHVPGQLSTANMQLDARLRMQMTAIPGSVMQCRRKSYRRCR